MLVFRKKLMMEALEADGNLGMVDDEIAEIMDKIDGKEAVPSFNALIQCGVLHAVIVGDECYPVLDSHCEEVSE